MAKDMTGTALSILAMGLASQGGGGGGEPSAYLKSASVSNNTLTLTNKDNTTVTFTPASQIPPLPEDLVNTYSLKFKAGVLVWEQESVAPQGEVDGNSFELTGDSYVDDDKLYVED